MAGTTARNLDYIETDAWSGEEFEIVLKPKMKLRLN